MREDYIYIVDDTGFNKDYIVSNVLKKEKACFCGVIVKKSNFDELVKHMNSLVYLLEKRFQSKELHFTEMYNQKGNFESIKDIELISIVRSLVNLIHRLDCHVINQSIYDFTYTDTPQLEQALKGKYLSKMQMSQNDKSNCLILSIIRAKRFIEQSLNGKLDYVICDEGIRKPNTSVFMPSNNSTEPSIKIEFKSSEEFPALQLADFVAWSLSRQKQALQKDFNKMTDKEISLLSEFSAMAEAMDATTLVKLKIDRDSSQKMPYDDIFNIDRKNKGLSDLN